MFHHGLIKLLVLNELQILDRDWASFLFVSGFEMDTVTPIRTPKPRRLPSPLVAEQSEPVGADQSEPVMMETKQLQRFDTPTVSPSKHKSTMSKPAKQEQVVSKQGSKRITRGQTVALEDKTVAKGNLEDILHAIDIEETPIVQVEDIDEGGQKLKKAKSAKKLEFEGEDAGFMFQARKPMTRHARKLLESSKEVLPITDTIKPSQDIIDLSSPA